MKMTINPYVWLSAGMFLAMTSLLAVPVVAATSYHAKAITGKVVDAETGTPLPGVNVVAQWQYEQRATYPDRTTLKVVETISDQNGDYTFPEWGLASIPGDADFGHGIDPKVIFFKHGYWIDKATNPATLDTHGRQPPLGEFKENGKTIRLKKWDEKDVKAYGIDIDNETHFDRDGKYWRHYPKLVAALIKEEKYLASKGYQWGLGALTSEMTTPENMKLIREWELK